VDDGGAIGPLRQSCLAAEENRFKAAFRYHNSICTPGATASFRAGPYATYTDYAHINTGCVNGTPTTKPHAVATAGTFGTFTFDCNGNMTSRLINSTTYTLTYDAENRLTIVNGGTAATFTYDGLDRLKTATGASPWMSYMIMLMRK